jgi:hypothetical protein
MTLVVHLELRISPRIFNKIGNGIIKSLGETDPYRKPEVKNLVALSLSAKNLPNQFGKSFCDTVPRYNNIAYSK